MHHYKSKRRTIIILSILILAGIYFFKDASFVLRAVSAVAFIAFFYITDRSYDLRFKSYHYFFIILIAVVSLLLSPLYFLYPHYDKIQHLAQPILISSIIFHLVRRLKIPLQWKLLFTFFIVMGIIGLFETGEYSLDKLFDLKLQGVYLRDLHGFEKFNIIQEPLDDTMIDMLLGIIGAGLYSGLLGIINYKYLRKID